jgi:hypothetical protein
VFLKESYSTTSVRDPDLHVFGPPGSGTGSISQRIRILPFSHKGVERTDKMLAK